MVKINAFPILRRFEKTELDDIDHSLFRSRCDTKFIVPPELLEPVFKRLSDSYRVLKIGDRFIQDYKSLYFDNEKFKFYLDHQNGKLNRYKVRVRSYLDTEHHFLEVKFKNNKRRTKKWRKEIDRTDYFPADLTDQDERFVDDLVKDKPGRLQPLFTVSYSRLALVHKKERERVTIDLDLSFQKGEMKKEFADLVIAEIKRERYSSYSEFFDVMHELHVRPMRFSKYCFGIYQFFPFLKYNRFKPRYLFMANKIGEEKNAGI